MCNSDSGNKFKETSTIKAELFQNTITLEIESCRYCIDCYGLDAIHSTMIYLSRTLQICLYVDVEKLITPNTFSILSFLTNQRINLNNIISNYTQVTLHIILYGSDMLPSSANNAWKSYSVPSSTKHSQTLSWNLFMIWLLYHQLFN